VRTRIGCCRIGSTIDRLPVSSGRWPGWPPPPMLVRSCYGSCRQLRVQSELSWTPKLRQVDKVEPCP
jgi:hypothetical protein